MPTYFFNVRHLIDDIDLHGTELRDLDEVWPEAIRASGEIFASIRSLPSGVPWVMEVVDEWGKTIMKVTVIAEKMSDKLH